MVGDGNPGALRLPGPHAPPQAIPQIGHKPDFRVSRELHEMAFPFLRLGLSGGCVGTKYINIKYRAHLLCLSITPKKDYLPANSGFAGQAIMPSWANNAGVVRSHRLKSGYDMNTDFVRPTAIRDHLLESRETSR